MSDVHDALREMKARQEAEQRAERAEAETGALKRHVEEHNEKMGNIPTLDNPPKTAPEGLRLLARWFDALYSDDTNTEVQDDLRRWSKEWEQLKEVNERALKEKGRLIRRIEDLKQERDAYVGASKYWKGCYESSAEMWRNLKDRVLKALGVDHWVDPVTAAMSAGERLKRAEQEWGKLQDERAEADVAALRERFGEVTDRYSDVLDELETNENAHADYEALGRARTVLAQDHPGQSLLDERDRLRRERDVKAKGFESERTQHNETRKQRDAALARERGLIKALNNLSFFAQTSGGTTGRDEGLVEAIEYARQALASQPESTPSEARQHEERSDDRD